ncbi:uncharacterized protein [Apostichopus japonicus]|uniref:uncharacterized protein n=1 Tax=Stichopus japonicus TaxID=307972 RepID=UPI003AB1EFA1
MAVATGQLARQFCRLRVWKVQHSGLLAGTRLSSTAAESRTKVLYDGDCPICQKEMAIVKYLNKKKGTLDLIDINKADFNPSEYGDFSQKELTDVFHVVDSNKQVYKGLHAMHKMYSDVGFGWTTTYLLWPGLHPIFNRMYMWFAKNRLRWTNRADLKTNLKA